ncbi:ROK family transcriptional regulator [Streptomyces sp. NPDC051976]|uniref:ROK family transcriptional regulator n=1 Tax=Streptomyces sp. NPDC051976 TaxID=3154947 RepID=UPI003442A302
MTARSANLATLRDLNARSVLDALVREHKLSRAEVARRLGMSKPTANHAIETLTAAGLVREAARPEGELHYGAVFFEPAFDLGQVLGIDIGGRWIRGALADLGGGVVARYDHPRTEGGATALLADIAEVHARLTADAAPGTAGVLGTMVAVAGVVEPESGRMRVTSEQELEGYPIIEALSPVLPNLLDVDNDVNLAALGELRRGAGRESEDFAFLAVGSGVGAGLVLEGRLRRGRNGAAGEIDYPGHRPFAVDSPAADSLRALIADGHRAEVRAGRAAGGEEPPTPEELFARARLGDPFALKVVREEAHRMAGSIATIALVVDVPLVVVGGGVGLNGAVLLDPLRSRLAQMVPFPPRVQISELGDAAVLIGAVSVAAGTAWPRLIDTRLADARSTESPQGAIR